MSDRPMTSKEFEIHMQREAMQRAATYPINNIDPFAQIIWGVATLLISLTGPVLVGYIVFETERLLSWPLTTFAGACVLAGWLSMSMMLQPHTRHTGQGLGPKARRKRTIQTVRDAAPDSDRLIVQ